MVNVAWILLEKFTMILFFLDDGLVGKTINDCKVIGKIEDMNDLYPQYKNIFIAIGNDKVRNNLVKNTQKIGFNVASLISTKSHISKYANFGIGCVVFPNVVIEANASIEDGCVICANSVINHDATIKDYCLINSSSIVRPTVLLNRFSHIGCSCLIGKEIEKSSLIEDGKVVI